jgi:hypothetical protein
MALSAHPTSSVSIPKMSCSIAAGSTRHAQSQSPNAGRDLFEAMKQVADTGHGPKEQFPSMGCSRSGSSKLAAKTEATRWMRFS